MEFYMIETTKPVAAILEEIANEIKNKFTNGETHFYLKTVIKNQNSPENQKIISMLESIKKVLTSMGYLTNILAMVTNEAPNMVMYIMSIEWQIASKGEQE